MNVNVLRRTWTWIRRTIFCLRQRRKTDDASDLRTVSERSWLRQLLSTFWDRDRKRAQVTLCRSFFADVPYHSRPPRSVMIVTNPSDRGLDSRSLSVQDCQYDLSTTAVRHWYDGSVWSALSTFVTTITTTTDTTDTTAHTMLTTTLTLLPICYHD